MTERRFGLRLEGCDRRWRPSCLYTLWAKIRRKNGEMMGGFGSRRPESPCGRMAAPACASNFFPVSRQTINETLPERQSFVPTFSPSIPIRPFFPSDKSEPASGVIVMQKTPTGIIEAAIM